jgi:hypothetical protein
MWGQFCTLAPLPLYIFFLIHVYTYLNKINTFTVRNYYTSWYRYLGKYVLDRFFLKPFLAHLTWRRLSSSSVVRRKLFQKSSPLKVLNQWKPSLVRIITRVSGDAVHQPTWPLLLKIEHMVKLQVLGNNSKTVNNIKNLTWCKKDQHIKIYLHVPCNFEVNLITHLGVIALFSSNL